MNSKILKGIAFILFGLLLCAGSGELNRTILHDAGDVPFALIGVIFGIVGLVMALSEKPE